MIATITIDAPQSKIDLLITLAREMGISVMYAGDYKTATDEVTIVSEAWDSDEDKRWDSLYKETQ
jgi:hypothetical protein